MKTSLVANSLASFAPSALRGGAASRVRRSGTRFLSRLVLAALLGLTSGALWGQSQPQVVDCACVQSNVPPVVACQAPIPDLCALTSCLIPGGYPPSLVTCTQWPAAGTLVGPGVHPIAAIWTAPSGLAEACTVSFVVQAPAGGCGTNPCVTPPPGMVGWWPLDDATNQSTVLDLAGMMHHGASRDAANTLVNIGAPPVWSLPDPAVFGGSLMPVVTDPATSPPRGALFLSGQGLVEVPHHPTLNIGSNGMTITLWVWPTVGSGGPQPLVEKYNVPSGDGYSLYLDPVGSGNFVLKFLLNGTVVTGATVAASVSPSDWRFVVARVDGGGNVTLSVCDTLGSCAISPSIVVSNFLTTNTAPLWFGKSFAANPGVLTLATRVGFDEIELFDRGLAQTEIQQIYEGERNGKRKCVTPVGGAEVCIFKFEDTNGNGQPDPGENGLPGWQFTVSPAPLPPTTSPVTTGPNGRICLPVAAPGTYTITEIVQPGWTPTTPTNQTVTVAAGQLANLLFGNQHCVPAPAGMVGWWPLDEANGSVTFAELQAGLNANIVPGPLGTPPSPNAVPGQVAGGAYFPAGNLGYGAVPANPALDVAGANFSIDAWIYPIGCGPQHVSPIVDKLRLGDPLSGYALGLLGGQLALALGDPLAGGQLYTCTLPLPANTWNFVAVSVDFATGTVTFFVNGAAQTLSSPAPAPKLPNTSSLWIGGSRLFVAQPPSPPCEIGLDEVEIFNRALGTNELGQILAAGPAGKCKPPCKAGYACAPDKTVECGTPWTFNPPTSTVPGCALQLLGVTTTTNALQPCGELIARTWRFVDCCGKTNSCTQTVTVLDTTPPLVYCPTNKTVECGAAWSFDPPTALDACCGTNVTITALNTVTNTQGPCQTVIRQTWEIRDCCTNSVTCSQTVTVVDTTPPVILCPGPITKFVCTNGLVVHYKPKVSDNCPGPVTVTCTPPSGSFFPVGSTVVTCTATDACGNTSSCSFTVTIVNTALWVTLPRGTPDCYARPAEPAVPGPCLTGAYPGGFWKNFDDQTVNRWVGVTWNFPLSWNILGAWLNTRLRPPVNGCAGGSGNDSISLGLTSCGPPAWLWSRYLGTGNPSAGLFPFQWCGGSDCNHNLTLNLAALPLAPSGTLSLLPHLNSTKRLDLFVQDDTTVDFAALRVWRCLPGHQVGGLDTTLNNARLVHGPEVWVLAPEEAGAPFGAELALGRAPGVLLPLEPLSLAASPGGHLELETLNEEAAPGIALRLEAGNDGQGRVILSRLPALVTNLQIELIVERDGVVIEQLPPKPVNPGDLLATFDPADLLIELGVLDGAELRASVLSQEQDGSTHTYTLRGRLCCGDLDGDGRSDDAWSGVRLMASGLPELPLQTPGLQLRGIDKGPIRRGMVIIKAGSARPLILAQNDQVAATPLDEQTGHANLRVSFPPTDEFVARIPSFFDVFVEDPLWLFETNGVAKRQKQWLPANFRSGLAGANDNPVSRDLCVTEFEQGTNGLWTLTLPEVGPPSEGQVQQVLLKGPAGQVSIPPQPAPAGGVLLGQCPELPPTRAARLSDPQERLVICRFVWPRPVLFRAADGTSIPAIALEILWRLPEGVEGSLTGLGLEATGTGALALGGLEFGPQDRGLRVFLGDDDGDGRPDVIEVLSDGVGGVLEEAPTLQGPWTSVADQFEQGAGRYSIPLPLQAQDNPARFFRVRY